MITLPDLCEKLSTTKLVNEKELVNITQRLFRVPQKALPLLKKKPKPAYVGELVVELKPLRVGLDLLQ